MGEPDRSIANRSGAVPSALVELALVHLTGLDGVVPTNRERARALVDRAARLDDMDALCILGDIEAGRVPGFGARPREALDWYRRAEALGDSRARFAAALILLNGGDVAGEPLAEDAAIAAALLRRCAADGMTRAYQTLGEVYRAGIGVTPEPAKALLAMHAAAAAGHPAACHMLGVMLWNGEGCEARPVEGYSWILEAAALGNGSESTDLLETLPPQMTDVEIAEAFALQVDWAEAPETRSTPIEAIPGEAPGQPVAISAAAVFRTSPSDDRVLAAWRAGG